MKNYLNATDKKDIVELFLVSTAVENVMNKEKLTKEVKTSLKYVLTYLVKAYDTIAKDYPAATKSIYNDMQYYRMLVLPEKQAYEKLDRLIKERKNNPRDAMCDIIDTTMSMLCVVGCHGKTECEFRKVLEMYEIEPVDPDDKICKWRL